MDSWNQMFCKHEMYFIYAHSESAFPFLSQPFTHKSQEIQARNIFRKVVGII